MWRERDIKMKLKRIISAVLVFGMLVSNTAFAEENIQKSNEKIQEKSASEVTDELSADVISDELAIYKNILTFLENAYYSEEVNKEQLMAEGINNLLKENPEMLAELFKATFESLDMYSTYYTKEEFDTYLQSINNMFYGIGVTIQFNPEGYIQVKQLIEGGPAEKAGIMVDDLIVGVDGENVVGLSVDEVRSKIVGEKLTEVLVTVKRGEEELSFTMLRDEVSTATVAGVILEGNIGYVQISNFSVNTAEEFKKIKAELIENNVKKLIIDLRNNPGGYMMSAVEIASELIPEGRIIEAKYKQEENNTVYTSKLKEAPFQICVLANSNTASASEILTSSIVESGTGILIGDNTYGKALIQDMYRISYGQAMKITIGEYITRNGNKINGVGIEPDEFVLNETRPIDTSKYTAFEYSSKYNIGDTGIDVKAAEERLARMGYNVGEVDENYTTQTALAVAEFQADVELYSYGVLDNTTQVAINNTFLGLTEVVDKQFEYAYEYLGGKSENLE